MNLIKKAIMFSFAFTLFTVNIECMQQQRTPLEELEDILKEKLNSDDIYSRPRRQPQTWTKAISNRIPHAWTIADYLTQLGSIYSIDSTNTKVINGLAIARTFFNARSINSWVGFFRMFGLTIDSASANALLSIFARGYNMSRDYKIWKNSSSIATSNAGRKSDKNLKNKKVCHYAWLTFNQVLRRVLQSMNKPELLKTVYYCSILTNLSELYRQHLMYELIEGKKKTA